MPEQFGIPCPCGSGQVSYTLNDARGICCGRVCGECEDDKKAQFDPAIFEDGDYHCDEPIEKEW
jgi:hypothetical protein